MRYEILYFVGAHPCGRPNMRKQHDKQKSQKIFFPKNNLVSLPLELALALIIFSVKTVFHTKALPSEGMWRFDEEF